MRQIQSGRSKRRPQIDRRPTDVSWTFLPAKSGQHHLIRDRRLMTAHFRPGSLKNLGRVRP